MKIIKNISIIFLALLSLNSAIAAEAQNFRICPPTPKKKRMASALLSVQQGNVQGPLTEEEAKFKEYWNSRQEKFRNQINYAAYN